MEISRRTFIVGGSFSAAMVAAQGLDLAKGWAQGGVINLYSARHYNTDNALYENFTKQSGIRVNLIEGKDKELLERIRAEGRNSPADILITVDGGNLWMAAQQGLFTPVNSGLLRQKIPANLRDPKNLWFGFSKRARILVYNKGRVNPSQLSSYEDLTNPRWRRRIAVRSSSNVYNQSLVASLIAIHGGAKTEQWCRGLVANFARPPQGGDTDQIKAVAAGQADVAIVNHYYLVRLMESKDGADQAVAAKVGAFFPNQRDRGTHMNISGAGVLKNAPNRAGAVRFLEYLASPSAQSFFAKGNNEFPVVQGTALDAAVVRLGTFKSDTSVNVALYGKNQAEAVRLMDRAGWK